MKNLIKATNQSEIYRYILNGLLATGIHYSVLTFNITSLNMSSAGLANLIAALFGISASFLGSRYYVFKKHHEPMTGQAMMFLALYTFIACLHGLVLFVWTDIYKFDYRIGFIISTTIQVTMSYLGNKFLVFKT